jgi:arylsulfatase A-like enzyme
MILAKLLCFVAFLQLASAAQSKPNLLLLYPDEWRFDWDGFHQDNGDVPLNVPNLRQYAAMGTRFEHVYVPAPVCAPSRSCLAAAREYDDAGVLSNFANDYPIDQPTFYTQVRFNVFSANLQLDSFIYSD